MKKLFLICTMIGCAVSFSFGNTSYKVNDAAVDEMFAAAHDITFVTGDNSELSSFLGSAPLTVKGGGGGTNKGGFLLRAFFCGFIGLHRSYMGSQNIWWKYLVGSIIPIVSFTPGIDFCWVLFSKDALNKYKNNNDWFVFLK